MPKINRIHFFLLSLVLSVIFLTQNYNTNSSANSRLLEDYKVQKMNLYPPALYRLANIIESRPEFAFYFRVEKNFTNVFDFTKLYSNPLELLTFFIYLILVIRTYLHKPFLSVVICTPQFIALSLYPASKEWLGILFLPVILLSLSKKYAK